MTESPNKPLQRIGEVCRRESISPRTLGRKLNLDIATAKKLRHPSTDIRLSDLYLVAEAVNVPATELLQDIDAGEVQLLRGLLVRIAKITNAMLEDANCTVSQRLMVESVKAIIDEALPSDCIKSMHTEGERRSLDDGRLIQGPVCVGDLDCYVDHRELLGP